MRWTVLVAALVLVTSASAAQTGGTPVALVTAEQQNAVLAVELPSGQVLRRASIAADPQNVAVGRDAAVIVSPASGTVTLLDPRTLRTLKVFRGFGAPHIVAVGPHAGLAYVTDDARGELDVIALGSRRIVRKVAVGAGAHHMGISPAGDRVWIALGEHAGELAIVDLSQPTRPRVMRRFSPGFVAHDVTFSPDGKRVWVTACIGESVVAFNARSGRRAFAVRVGAAPQHVAFNGDFAFATSGYGNRIVKIDPRTGRVLKIATTPHGSFNLSTAGGLVVTTSLLDGRVTEFDTNLRRLMSARVARAARGIAVTVWP